MNGRSGEELFQRVPVVAVPARIQVIVLAGGEAGVVKDHGGPGRFWPELKVDDGVGAGVPVCGAPGLNDALVGDELNSSTNDEAAKLRECPAGGWVDGCGQSGKRRELLLVEEGLVKAVGTGLEIDLVVDGCAGRIGGVSRFLGCRLLDLRADHRGGRESGD